MNTCVQKRNLMLYVDDAVLFLATKTHMKSSWLWQPSHHQLKKGKDWVCSLRITTETV